MTQETQTVSSVPGAGTLPRIISVDDHVVEPPHLWQERLPAKWRSDGPRVERRRGELTWSDGVPTFVESDDAGWVDTWRYEDLVWPLSRGYAMSGYDGTDVTGGVTFDDILPACFQQPDRLLMLDQNYTDASLGFPTFPRFCGQTFLEAQDKELALLCVQAYNDWMIDDWCAGEGRGRLIPLTIIPLWDVELAAAEIRRCAAKGSHAMCFSEQPAALGLPSIYSGYWEPLWAACEETETVVNMHIGSSSKLPVTSSDAPWEALITINVENTIHAFTDWLISGILERFKTLKIAFSEGQVGWSPFFIHRMDDIWKRSESYGSLKDQLPEPPSHYIPGRVYGCIFDDPVGLRNRDLVGMSQIMIETDFPHADSTFPHSRKIAESLIAEARLDEHEAWQLLRGNAIACYGLERWGVLK